MGILAKEVIREIDILKKLDKDDIHIYYDTDRMKNALSLFYERLETYRKEYEFSYSDEIFKLKDQDDIIKQINLIIKLTL